MCTYATVTRADRRQRQGPERQLVPASPTPTVYFDHPVHAMADHTLNIDLAAPANGPVGPGRGRADRGVGPRAGDAIQAALASAPAELTA